MHQKGKESLSGKAKTYSMDGVGFDISPKASLPKVIILKAKEKPVFCSKNIFQKKNDEAIIFHSQIDEKFEQWARSVEEYTGKSLLETKTESASEINLGIISNEDEKSSKEGAVERFETSRELERFFVGNEKKASIMNHGVPVPHKKTKIQKKKNERGYSLLEYFFSNYKGIHLFDGDRLGNVGKPMFAFASIASLVLLLVSSLVYISYGFQVKEDVQVLGQQAIGHLESAKEGLENKDFEAANDSFESALASFDQAQGQVDLLGGDMLDIFSNLPWLSRVSSGKNVVYAGNELTKSAKELSAVVALFSSMENPLEQNTETKTSLTEIFLESQGHITVGKEHLDLALGYVEKVRVEDLPAEYQEKFRMIKQTLPLATSAIESFNQHSEIFLELLGHNGPRKYLMLFQNNHELRPTGGFIGSYGLLSISDGKINKLMIDGIFNPDGQFREDIIPPKPLQKITAGWSTHDANWFPNFPDSAKKIASFYEKTEGPTVDGIITMTPVVMEKMLEITGPIEMPEYGVIINSDNFIEETQYKVEVDYDKEENKPKKFLADLAPQILNKIFAVSDPVSASKVIATLSNALHEKDILLYSFEDDVQDVISKRGWSGEILPTKKDYLMVVDANINGYKTDGIIDEEVFHKSEIMADGTIINTVRVKRTHNGGDTKYEWWNKVNSDYMRVYVPQGSELISVSGQTREFIDEPLDYEKLGFKKDPDISAQEESMVIDENSGTRIYTENGKTVFANWTYVSPKESMEIEYVYKLPFKLDFNKNSEKVDTYSLLVQKQPGSQNPKFQSEVEFGDGVDVAWKFPENIELESGKAKFEKRLNADKFVGVVLQKK